MIELLLLEYKSLNMSWSFWRSSSDAKQQSGSIIEKTQSFLSSSLSNSFRRQSLNTPTTSQFEDYLASLPSLKKLTKKKKSLTSVSTLKPQLLKRCMEVVDKQYFSEHYEVDEAFFQKKRKNNQERQLKLQEQLDQVQVCLFNQMSSRFDQILSVLRTIQSLDFLVVDNQKKLKMIRQDNFSKVIKVSQKQTKMTALIRRKKNLEAVLQFTSKIKQYKKFQQLESALDSSDTVQAFYSAIPTIKKYLPIYNKLRATRNFGHQVEQLEATLKRSFSDKINQKLLQYLKKQIPYQTQFWRKQINNNKILQDKQQGDSTALLDESGLMGGQQQSVIILPKKQENIETMILDLIKKGWQDGEYSAQKLKTDIDVLLKSKHNAFMLDFRNFCDQICKKHQRQVQNPSLTNLLKEISATFCSKVYNYFFDIHKSILLRFFSTARKVYQLIINMGKNNLTIDQKQKLTMMAEGFTTCGTFLMRLILQKLVDITQTKYIHEGVDIAEIKLIVGVLENAQTFIEKQIITLTDMPETENSYLGDLFCDIAQRFPIKILQIAKKKKLTEYLNKMHKNALTIQLKQSLQNQIWQPTDIPTFYYDSLHYLITGQSLNLRRNKHNLKNQQSSMLYETSVLMDSQKQQSFYQQPNKLMGNFRIIRNDIIINGKTYKVTQTLLLLLQILEDYMTLSQNFPGLKDQIGQKINQIIRSYNVSSCQLIVHAGAVALQKIKSKNINSRHLALSSLCLSFILYIMECLEKRIEIFQSQKLKQSVQQHIDMIYKKLYQILIYKATSLKTDINLKSTPSKGTQGIVNNTKILLQILSDFYGKDVLQKIFTKQFLTIYLDAIKNIQVTTKVEAEALKDDVAFFFGELKGLQMLNNDFIELRIAAQDVVRRGFEDL